MCDRLRKNDSLERNFDSTFPLSDAAPRPYLGHGGEPMILLVEICVHPIVDGSNRYKLLSTSAETDVVKQLSRIQYETIDNDTTRKIILPLFVSHPPKTYSLLFTEANPKLSIGTGNVPSTNSSGPSQLRHFADSRKPKFQPQNEKITNVHLIFDFFGSGRKHRDTATPSAPNVQRAVVGLGTSQSKDGQTALKNSFFLDLIADKLEG